jgi:thiol-disulfide isomerase/thioredoxin
MLKNNIGGYVTFLFLTCANLMGTAYAAGKIAPGDTPPLSLGQTREGQSIETSQYAGKVLVVTFWASWCGPCKKELPILEAIQNVAGTDKIQVVAVNIEEREQFIKIARALSSLKLTLTHDSRRRSADAYGVNGIPHLVLIGRDGKVINVRRGYSEEAMDSIIAEINTALAAPDVAGDSKGSVKAGT